ncbi:16074_t:CDS:2 [Cetraspora pellucida]|uniref:16074_t:CDS:1 n=1 Tax=Cetraspora pellucida TaxID=1433469 RepID=A0ACA9L5Y2_9GLOM|nr:16074_t:CDS:2 [Cetraspora pellucida]
MNTNITPEQKEKNRQYILANLDKYTIDTNGNFFNVDPELLGESSEDNIFCYIGRGALTPEAVDLIHFRNKQTGVEIHRRGWAEEPKTKPESQTEQENQNSTPTNNNTPNQSPQPTNQEPEQQDQPTNNPLPTPETIQENYNNDKDKSTIENSPNSTTPEQKEQFEALLKLIIGAELSIKNNQFNPETLSKLIQEKEQNTETYQLLKERIEQAINELSSLQQKQDNSNEPTVNKQPTMGPIKVLAIVGVIGVVVIISALAIKILKKKKSD